MSAPGNCTIEQCGPSGTDILSLSHCSTGLVLLIRQSGQLQDRDSYATAMRGFGTGHFLPFTVSLGHKGVHNRFFLCIEATNHAITTHLDTSILKFHQSEHSISKDLDQWEWTTLDEGEEGEGGLWYALCNIIRFISKICLFYSAFWMLRLVTVIMWQWQIEFQLELLQWQGQDNDK